MEQPRHKNGTGYGAWSTGYGAWSTGYGEFWRAEVRERVTYVAAGTAAGTAGCGGSGGLSLF